MNFVQRNSQVGADVELKYPLSYSPARIHGALSIDCLISPCWVMSTSGISEEDQRRVRSTDGRRNVFRIPLFCMLEGFESRGVDFLKAAYDLFQSRNYCLLTLPYTSGEFPLLKEFTRVQTLPGSLYGCDIFLPPYFVGVSRFMLVGNTHS